MSFQAPGKTPTLLKTSSSSYSSLNPLDADVEHLPSLYFHISPFASAFKRNVDVYNFCMRNTKVQWDC